MSSGRDSRFWLVPALTFLFGLLLGGLVIGVGTIGSDGVDGDQPQAAETAAPTPTEAPSGDSTVTVTVPGSCIEAAELSERVLGLGQRAATALGGLDARSLQDVVAEMRDLEPQVREAATECRDTAAAANLD